jgi:hypothetical protein
VVFCDHSKIVISMTEGPVAPAGRAAEMGAMLLKAPSPPYPHTHSARDLNFAFCRKIAEAHGERLWISSSRTGGLLAAFSLPQVSASLVSVGSL